MTPPASTPVYSARARLAAVLLAVTPAVVKLVSYPHNIGSDDAYIHLRVADNFVHGLGWGINPDQPVNLSTAPAFTFILALAERFSPHAIGIVQILSALAVIAGLLVISLTVSAETGSVAAGLVAEATAAFSNNLWRWNGTLMETTFAFSIVCFTFYLLRQSKKQTPLASALLGLLLGVGLLMRPEMGMLLVLAAIVLALRGGPGGRLRLLLPFGIAALAVFLAWVTTARNLLRVSVLPTTFAAKSVHGIILWNPRLLKEFTLAAGESFLIPAIFVAAMVYLATRKHAWRAAAWPTYFLPVAWILGVLAFFYLKTRNLESTGRYVLLLLPAEAILIALLWRGAATEKVTPRYRMITATAFACSLVFALLFDHFLVSPVLKRFEGEYAASMRAAASELTSQTAQLTNKKVLVEVDIGVLSYTGNSRFEVFDGASLATPYLHGLSLKDQVKRVRPSIVVQTLATSPDGFRRELPPSFQQVWSRRFFRHSIGVSQPYYYVIVFADKQSL